MVKHSLKSSVFLVVVILTLLFQVNVLVASDKKIETNIKNGDIYSQPKVVIEVRTTENGNIRNVDNTSVKLNGISSPVLHKDNYKTSFMLNLTQTGENDIDIANGEITESFLVYYQPNTDNRAVIAVEAFTIGGGYLIEPTYVDLIPGENAAETLTRLLTENGYSFSNYSVENFYLKDIYGDINYGTVPDVIFDNLDLLYYDEEYFEEGKLGENDFTLWSSGWMYCVNNIFPNVGFSDYYLNDGDVMRVQYTLFYGADIGGYNALGRWEDWESIFNDSFLTNGENGAFSVPNKDAMTVFLADYFEDHYTIPSEYLDIVSRLDGQQIQVPQTIYPDIFPNNDELIWPSDSGEVTLWYGPIDDQYTDFNKGINIQGEVNGNVYSICDGVVTKIEETSGYGTVVYIAFRYNNQNMQARYGLLSEASNIRVRKHVNKGDVIGKMIVEPDTGKGLLNFSLGKINQQDDVDLVNPIDYLNRPYANSSYLREEMATFLDTNGIDTTMSEDEPALRDLDIIWPWEDSSDPDVRYKKNKDLASGEVYLRKLIVEYGENLGAIDTTDIEEIISYDSSIEISTVTLNGRTKQYGVSLGNAVNKNNRLVVNQEKVWYDLIGNIYTGSEGGTWVINEIPNEFEFTYQKVYMPYEIANKIYLVTDSPWTGEIRDLALGALESGLGAVAVANLNEKLLHYFNFSLPVGKISLFTAGIITFYDIMEHVERDNYRKALLNCPENHFVVLRRKFTITGGIASDYYTSAIIKDDYECLGTFTPGTFSGFDEIL